MLQLVRALKIASPTTWQPPFGVGADYEAQAAVGGYYVQYDDGLRHRQGVRGRQRGWLNRPCRWFGSATWWLACVSAFAFAYVHAPGCWLFYDVQFWGTRHILLPDNPAALDFLADFTTGCTVLHMKRQGPSQLWFRVGFWCVPAIKHLCWGCVGCFGPVRSFPFLSAGRSKDYPWMSRPTPLRSTRTCSAAAGGRAAEDGRAAEAVEV
jgi:hypothetical protein